VRNAADRTQFARWISANNTPLPENGFRGTNRSRYINPEFDAQITRYQTTIPLGDRLQIYGDLLHFMTDQQLFIGLFYDVEADLVGRRLQNFQIPQNYEAWAAINWDLID
jgi:ABC-type transport system substrate-binding protein